MVGLLKGKIYINKIVECGLRTGRTVFILNISSLKSLPLPMISDTIFIPTERFNEENFSP